MIECISIINQKGGVGKSTTSNSLGAGLFIKGYKVLYIDLDAQGNLTYSIGGDSEKCSTFELLTGKATAEELIINTKQGDLIQASSNLASADTILTQTGKEYKLREAIEPLKNIYDYIIIDTPPALGTLTINALTSCNSVIIPAQADIYSLQGIGQLNETIQTVKNYCNPNLIIKGILVTRYSSRNVISKDMLELLKDTAKRLNTKLYDTKIRECIALKESQAVKQDIYTYSPKSNASIDYKAFIEEVVKVK